MIEIEKNIRKHAIFDVLKLSVPTLLFVGISVMFLCGIFSSGFDISIIFMDCIFTVLAVFVTRFFIKAMIIAINPLKSDVFKKYGNIDDVKRIYNEIFSTKEYSDYIIYISKNYICNYERWDVLIPCDEVLAIYKYVHRRNFVVDRYGVKVTDKYGDTYSFFYARNQEAQCDYAIRYLAYKCKNASVGYTQRTFDHINANKISLKDNQYSRTNSVSATPSMPSYSNLNNNIQNTFLSNTPITPQQPIDQSQTLNSTKPTDTQPNSIIGKNNFCTKCGAKLIDGSKFCRKCGTEIYQNKN